MSRWTVTPLGDETLIIRLGRGARPWALAEALDSAGLPGVVEAFASYDTVGVCYEPESFSETELARWLDGYQSPEAIAGRRHVIPVCYTMGEDLEEVARTVGLATTEVAALHADREYVCAAIGFQPGFPYLGPLPVELCGVPRRAQPRVSVPAGSVGVTGDQTGVYPAAGPGGWALIGTTPLCLADLRDGYFPILAGDVVVFEAIGPAMFGRLEGERL